MAHDKHAQHPAHAEKDEAIFVIRVSRVIDALCALMSKNRLGLVEAHAVLFRVCRRFQTVARTLAN